MTATVGERSCRAPLQLAGEVARPFADRAARYDREARFPDENFADLRAAGLLALCVPERYGGVGGSFADALRVTAEIARHCASTALAFSMHCQAVLWSGPLADDLDMTAVERERHEQSRTRLYRGIVERGDLISQAGSEGGGNTVETTGTPVDGGYVVSGRKPIVTMASAAAACGTVCVAPGDGRWLYLLVRADNPGMTAVGRWDSLGMRATDSRSLVFDDAFVRTDDELLPAGRFEQLSSRWPHIFMSLTASYLGLTRAIVDAVEAQLATSPHVGVKRHAWAEIQIAYERSRVLWERVVGEAGVDPGPPALRRALVATYTVMETVAEVAALAIRTCGGRSLVRGTALERHFRDARCGALMRPWSAEACLERLGGFGLDGGRP